MLEEAELHYKETNQTGNGGKKSSNVDTMYAFQAIMDNRYDQQHHPLLRAQLANNN
jgi:hypothetical protein